MKAPELQKILDTAGDVAADALDHLAKRFADGADKLGDEYQHLAEFAAGWQKLSRRSRRLFAQQFLKPSALVIAGTVATKAGLVAAGKKQKQLLAMVMTVADLIEPAARKAGKKAEKKAERSVHKAKRKLKKAAK